MTRRTRPPMRFVTVGEISPAAVEAAMPDLIALLNDLYAQAARGEVVLWSAGLQAGNEAVALATANDAKPEQAGGK